MRKLFLIISFIYTVNSDAQSFHFSQFYSVPLMMNPAFTGYTDGPYRVSANYRSQWSSSEEPYTTTAVSGDFNLLRGKLAQGNRLGMGVVIVSDKTMAGVVQSNYFGLSAAYNLVLDDDQIHHVGLGFQGVYKQRRIDFSHLSFENQLTSGGFDITLPTGETLASGTRGYFDFNAGALYNYFTDDKSFFIGGSVFNILKQKDLYLEDGFTMPKRFSAMAGGRMDVGAAGIFNLSVNSQFQGKVSETTVGASFGLQLGDIKKQVISLGAWHRLNDAIIPYIGFQLTGFQAGLSYDYTVSKLKTAGQVRNGFELSLMYTAEDKTEQRRLIPWY